MLKIHCQTAEIPEHVVIVSLKKILRNPSIYRFSLCTLDVAEILSYRRETDEIETGTERIGLFP